MKAIFYAVGILASGAGVLIFINAQSAIHEIEAFLLFLISAVFLVDAGVIDAIERNSD